MGAMYCRRTPATAASFVPRICTTAISLARAEPDQRLRRTHPSHRPSARGLSQSMPVPWLVVGRLVLANLDTIIGVVEAGVHAQEGRGATESDRSCSIEQIAELQARCFEQCRSSQTAREPGERSRRGIGAGRDRRRGAARGAHSETRRSSRWHSRGRRAARGHRVAVASATA